MNDSLPSIDDKDVLVRKANALGLPNNHRHIMLCCDQTIAECCDKQASIESWTYLKNRLKELKLSEKGGIMRYNLAMEMISRIRDGCRW